MICALISSNVKDGLLYGLLYRLLYGLIKIIYRLKHIIFMSTHDYY